MASRIPFPVSPVSHVTDPLSRSLTHSSPGCGVLSNVLSVLLHFPVNRLLSRTGNTGLALSLMILPSDLIHRIPACRILVGGSVLCGALMRSQTILSSIKPTCSTEMPESSRGHRFDSGRNLPLSRLELRCCLMAPVGDCVRVVKSFSIHFVLGKQSEYQQYKFKELAHSSSYSST